MSTPSPYVGTVNSQPPRLSLHITSLYIHIISAAPLCSLTIQSHIASRAPYIDLLQSSISSEQPQQHNSLATTNSETNPHAKQHPHSAHYHARQHSRSTHSNAKHVALHQHQPQRHHQPSRFREEMNNSTNRWSQFENFRGYASSSASRGDQASSTSSRTQPSYSTSASRSSNVRRDHTFDQFVGSKNLSSMNFQDSKAREKERRSFSGKAKRLARFLGGRRE